MFFKNKHGWLSLVESTELQILNSTPQVQILFRAPIERSQNEKKSKKSKRSKAEKRDKAESRIYGTRLVELEKRESSF